MTVPTDTDTARELPPQDGQPSSSGVLSPVIDFLRRHVPFDQLSAPSLEFMAKRLNLTFYAAGEKITDPAAGPATRFVIIKQGLVRGESPGGRGQQLLGNAWELSEGECFPIGALLGRRPVHTIHRAIEDTFCYELDHEDFDKLLKQSGTFNDFCTRRLASLLDQVHAQVQAQAAHDLGSDSGLNLPVSECVRRTPITCPPGTSVRSVLHVMDQERIGSMIVTDVDGAPIGVFTLHDLLSRVSLPERPLDDAIDAVMTPDPLTITADAFAFEAAMRMADNGIGHICVTRHGCLVGVLSESDIFSLQRVGFVQLSRAIGDAGSIAAVARLAREIAPFVGQLIAQGVEVSHIGRMITLLNDRIARRVIELCTAEHGDTGVEYTWLVFGSEGRSEQTLKTDQDNGMIFSAPTGMSADAARERLLPLARKINEALDACGFPLCKGNVMASNPECCLSLEEWQARFARWIDQGTPEHLLQATIFFDFRALKGPKEPVERLRDWLLDRVKPNSRFRRQMAPNALRFRPPLGVIRDFKVSSGGKHPHTIDLKLQGVTPFVDAARIMALASGVAATNTADRLREIAEQGAMSASDAEAYVAAYEYIQLLRMRTHQEQAKVGEDLSNHVDPDTLNELDKRILKESFRQARKLQSKLAVDYQL
jgi:CBS domain-containing protein